MFFFSGFYVIWTCCCVKTEDKRVIICSFCGFCRVGLGLSQHRNWHLSLGCVMSVKNVAGILELYPDEKIGGPCKGRIQLFFSVPSACPPTDWFPSCSCHRRRKRDAAWRVEIQRRSGQVDPDWAFDNRPLETQDGCSQGESVRAGGIWRGSETGERRGLRSLSQPLDPGTHARI